MVCIVDDSTRDQSLVSLPTSESPAGCPPRPAGAFQTVVMQIDTASLEMMLAFPGARLRWRREAQWTDHKTEKSPGHGGQ